MNIGILLPGFSSDESDWAIPVQLNLVREMAKSADVRVLALRYPHRRDAYSIFGAKVYSLGVGQVRGFGRLMLWGDAIRTLRRLHREKPFDVLHAMWADETGLIAVWAGRLLGIPAVVSIAGGELVGFEDIGYGLQRSAFSRWIVRQALEGADAVVVACSYVRRLIGERGCHVPEERIHTIALGVDTTVFYPADNRKEISPISDGHNNVVSQNSAENPSPIPSPFGVPNREGSTRGRLSVFKSEYALSCPRPDEHFHLIHVASLVGVKDQAMLLRALARLKATVTLDILGVGVERQQLEALAVELGIRERVNFRGAVHHLDLPRYYQQADLNILVSRHEGLGMVTLEAAACGIPTVSTAVGLLPDYPQMGITVPVSDDAALAAAIQHLMTDRASLSALGMSAYATLNEKFTIEHSAASFQALYRSLSQ